MIAKTRSLDQFREAVQNSRATIERYKSETNRPVIGVLPAYFPLEWIYAAGGYPVQIWGNSLPPGRSDEHLQGFTCSMVRSALELELRGAADLVDGYAFISICDTLSNLREILRRIVDKPQVSLEIPQARAREARIAYLKLLLEELNANLAEITGRKPTSESLHQAGVQVRRMRELQRELYARRRRNPGFLSAADFYTVLRAGYFIPADAYNELLSDFLSDDEAAGESREASTARGDSDSVRLVLSGMYIEPFDLYTEIFDPLGIQVVDDDFANGWRTVSRDTLNDAQGDSPEQALERMLFSGSPCSCIHDPRKDRGDYLIEKARVSDAQGVLIIYQKFCEPEAFDRPGVLNKLKAANIPATFVEVEMFMRNFDQLRNRISAFHEMLED